MQRIFLVCKNIVRAAPDNDTASPFYDPLHKFRLHLKNFILCIAAVPCHSKRNPCRKLRLAYSCFFFSLYHILWNRLLLCRLLDHLSVIAGNAQDLTQTLCNLASMAGKLSVHGNHKSLHISSSILTHRVLIIPVPLLSLHILFLKLYCIFYTTLKKITSCL